MTIPANYDTSSLNVDPYGLNSSAQTVTTAVQSIADDLTTINNTLSGLRLEWTGPSATDATDFNNKWTAAMNTLFGDGTDSNPGILGTLTGGMSSAAVNYSGVESQITSMYNQFANAITAGAPQGTPPPPAWSPVSDQVTDTYYHTTSVNEG